jgi:type IV pilus assembly protein PilP
MKLPGIKFALRTALALLLVVSLAACVSPDMSDLENYTAEVLSRPGGRIEPVPPIKPAESYIYQSAGARDPFQSFFQPEEPPPGPRQTDNPFADEIATHNREELENYELDSLRMVGILEAQESLWGIVSDTAGTVHRVQVGNYMGRNYGKILNIQEDRIDLREIIRDSQGRWEERSATLALTEE